MFIDTNVFMDTDPRHKDHLKSLFERIAPQIESGGSPVVVPTKVIDELSKFAKKDPSTTPAAQAAAFEKAKNALTFLRSAEAHGLVRTSLGDIGNPYADDLFVHLFEVYSSTYAMFLLTNDVTLQLRINLMALQLNRSIAAGYLIPGGHVEVPSLETIARRASAKLRRLRQRQATPQARASDTLEIESLETTLEDLFQEVPLLASLDAGTSTGARPNPPSDDTGDGRSRRQPFSTTAKFAGPDEIITVTVVPSAGDDILVDSPQGIVQMQLATKLGEGGEGAVYSASDSHVIKIFDEHHITKHREAKIRLLSARNFDEPGICFPEAIVRNTYGEFVGYLMPRAQGSEFSKVIFQPRRLRRTFPDWTKADLVDVAISFLEKVSYLHSHNILLGDINPKNVLVDDEKNVTIIDADSWQVEGFPCPVGVEMYSPPEVIGKRFPEFLRTAEDERFAVATMLFMILITGLFPYARSGSDGDVSKLIREGNFALQFKDRSNKDQPAGKWKYMWSHVQVDVKSLFWNTFHRDGTRYSSRPTDAEWLKAFRNYRRFLRSSENFDPMSNDIYPTRFKAMSPATPLYECESCRCSMAGIWREETKTFSTPRLCVDCRPALVACQGCQRSMAPDKLSNGKCRNCSLPTCTDCGRRFRPQAPGIAVCGGCITSACRECGSRHKKASMKFGRCPTCHDKDVAARARRMELDRNRLCTRCGKPFITFGNVEWHLSNHKAVPTTHKMKSGVYPADCVPIPRSTTSASAHEGVAPDTKSSGCFVATAAFGTYDCPEVWVLRRWRDTVLLTSPAGRRFVASYYATSPHLVRLVGGRSWFTTPTRWLLRRFANQLNRSGLASTPYDDPPAAVHPIHTSSGGAYRQRTSTKGTH
ncbi:hypothetical protein IGS67_08105 [Flavimobilis sp. GY10621]|uniref:Protein kinase domain-containing protein n=1 Tax=Flavimobilis rhizosphaerae TaxID=2775421 RepID=A0ABR9DQR4_9MICO|nr:CFI-box-CTERM domain-containing protein [Flavimobilis rhizosphaerae]MBD9699451.1 hypothetical protein [Flavimobilis rhizosphaerae]